MTVFVLRSGIVFSCLPAEVDFIKVGRTAHGAWRKNFWARREFNFGRGAISEAFFGAERMAQKLLAQSAIDKDSFIKVWRVAHGA